MLGEAIDERRERVPSLEIINSLLIQDSSLVGNN